MGQVSSDRLVMGQVLAQATTTNDGSGQFQMGVCFWCIHSDGSAAFRMSQVERAHGSGYLLTRPI